MYCTKSLETDFWEILPVLFARAAVLNDAFQDQMEVICEHVRKMLKSQVEPHKKICTSMCTCLTMASASTSEDTTTHLTSPCPSATHADHTDLDNNVVASVVWVCIQNLYWIFRISPRSHGAQEAVQAEGTRREGKEMEGGGNQVGWREPVSVEEVCLLRGPVKMPMRSMQVTN